jgi:hypothetical protein
MDKKSFNLTTGSEGINNGHKNVSCNFALCQRQSPKIEAVHFPSDKLAQVLHTPQVLSVHSP